MTAKDIDNKNKYLDGVAKFIVKHVPDYTELPDDSKNALEHIWIALANNRVEFIRVLDNVKPTRKKRK
jgi:hypothetical protein